MTRTAKLEVLEQSRRHRRRIGTGPLRRPPRPHRPQRRDHAATESRLHLIGLGRRHAGTRVLNSDGQLLRELQLDPTRDYQPQDRP